jgi:hypothetical protein
MKDGDVQRANLSIELAQQLRDAGLVWQANKGDRFAIPDRGFDDRTFLISDMVIEVRDVLGARELAFNGTVEWALDAILKTEVIWVPSESQLRESLGNAFVACYRDDDDGYAVVARVDEVPRTFAAPTAANAYGAALLAVLRA